MISQDTFSYFIVPATQDHIKAIAHINFDCWQHNFGDIFEKRYLREISLELFEQRWHHSYHQNKLQYTIVAVKLDGDVLGFISVGHARDPEFTGMGEVYAIYVSPAYQFQGIGKALWQKGLDCLRQLEWSACYVWVIGACLPSLRFFRTHQGRFEKTRSIKIASQSYFEICYMFQI